MNKIPDTFLKYASDVLADTDKGLTGTQIVRYFSAKSVEENVNIVHSEQPFKDKNDNNVNKRTAFFQNLSCFPPQLQYQIIIDLCERHNKEGFADLMKLTIERYGGEKTVLTPESAKPQVRSTPQINQYENIISNEVLTSQSNFENRRKMQTENTKPKTWYKQPQYFVPILIAIISGLFLVWQANIQKEKPAMSNNAIENRVTYELILIDHTTFKTPVFKIPNAKIKIYNSTPPTVVQIVDGTAKFESDPKLLENPVLIEFENISNYTIVDREHSLKSGKNEILVKKK